MSVRSELGALTHPGPVAAERITSVAGQTIVATVWLEPGRRLVDAIDDVLTEWGLDSAQVELVGGPLGRVAYCFPARCTDGSRAAWYSPTYETAAPATLIGGSATVGRRDAERFMHCHATWFDAFGGLHGGHLWPETEVGQTPVIAIVHAFDSVAMTSAEDPETLMPVFTPQHVPSSLSGTRRAVMSRVRPGVEIADAIARVMRGAGFTRATVGGSLGSLVGATLVRPDGTHTVVGPATEVVIGGVAECDEDGLDHGHLTAAVVDLHGDVHLGLLATTGNLVAVTCELLVEETAS